MGFLKSCSLENVEIIAQDEKLLLKKIKSPVAKKPGTRT
jgi:hypothetical protein